MELMPVEVCMRKPQQIGKSLERLCGKCKDSEMMVWIQKFGVTQIYVSITRMSHSSDSQEESVIGFIKRRLCRVVKP